MGQVESFCVLDVRQCQLLRKQGRTKQQSPGRAVHAKDYVLQLSGRRCIP